MEHTTHADTLELSGSLDVRCTAELRAALYGAARADDRGDRASTSTVSRAST